MDDQRIGYATIERLPGYRFGNDGSVQSCWSRGGHCPVHTDIWRDISESRMQKGYSVTWLTVNGDPERFLTHRLILEAFVGPCPDGMEACHNNGIKADNRIDNLRWDTHEGNSRDKIRHGTQQRGEKHPIAKLTDQDVINIREEYRSGRKGVNQIARDFGVSSGTVSMIVQRKSWAHIP